MANEFDNINLLPEDLRRVDEQEANRSRSANNSVPTEFYIPKSPETYKAEAPKKETPPVEHKVVAEPAEAKPKPAPVSKAKLVSQISQTKNNDFFKKFIDQLKVLLTPKKSDQANNQIKTLNFKKGSSESSNGDLMGGNLKSIDVNLIPEGTYLLPPSKILNSVFRSIILGVLLICLAYFSIAIYRVNVVRQDTQLSTEIGQISQQLEQLKPVETEATILSNKFNAVKTLFNNHIYWTQFLAKLEELTLPDVYYAGLNARTDGFLALEAVAPDYLTLAKQLKRFHDNTDAVESVEVTNISGNSSAKGVNFNLLLKLKPELYFKQVIK
jgi:hypothetical protein